MQNYTCQLNTKQPWRVVKFKEEKRTKWQKRTRNFKILRMRQIMLLSNSSLPLYVFIHTFTHKHKMDGCWGVWQAAGRQLKWLLMSTLIMFSTTRAIVCRRHSFRQYLVAVGGAKCVNRFPYPSLYWAMSWWCRLVHKLYSFCWSHVICTHGEAASSGPSSSFSLSQLNM